MVHLVYCDNKTNEIKKIINETKSMIIRGANGRKIPHSRVFVNDTLYFMEKGTKDIIVKAKVTEVLNYIQLDDNQINEIIEENNQKLQLVEWQKERWHKKCLCLVAFNEVTQIEPLTFEHQSNMDDWLILEKIEDVLVGSSKSYNYDNSRLK